MKYKFTFLMLAFPFFLGAQNIIFSENFDGLSGAVPTDPATLPYHQVLAAGTCSAANSWKYASSDATGTLCNSCAGRRAAISYTNTCAQDATLVLGPFVSSTPTVDISFTHGYNDFTPVASGDYVQVILRNETAATNKILATYTTDQLNKIYLSTDSVVIGDTYSLQFRYVGDNDWGWTVDNVQVEENCNAPVYLATVIEDCGNAQYSVDVNVSDFGLGTGADLTDGTTSFNNISLNTTYTFGPYTTNIATNVSIDATAYAGCESITGLLGGCMPDVCTDALDIENTSRFGNLMLATAEVEPSPNVNGTSCDATTITTTEADLWYGVQLPINSIDRYLEVSFTFEGASDEVYLLLEDNCASGNASIACEHLVSTGVNSTVVTDFGKATLAGSAVSAQDYRVRVVFRSGSSTGGFSISGELFDATPLPIELTYFDGKAMSNYNELVWTWESVSSFKRIELQRADDGVHFETIHSLPWGKMEGLKSYTYKDFLFTAKSYYRLKLIDENGSYEWSSIRAILNDFTNNAAIFPNPLDVNNLNVYSPFENTLLTIIDSNGRVAKRIQLNQKIEQIELTELLNGVYTVTLQSDQSFLTERLVILR